MKRILVGSRAFFNTMEGFHSKDSDYLILVDEASDFLWRREINMRGICTFVYKKESIENMVMRTIQNGDALLLGKFLVPAVLEFLGAQIEDILPLKVLLPKLDEKHKYQALIFNAYIQNNAFVLSDEQRLDAYHQYLLPRQTKKTK